MLSEQEQDRFAVSMAAWRMFVVVLTAVVVLLLNELFASKAQAGCKQVAAVQIQTQFIAVPVATPIGYPAYVSPVANVGLVAYGAPAKAEGQGREAKSVDTPVPPSPDGVPYEEYLRQFAAYLNVKHGTQYQPQVQPTTAPQAAPKASLVSLHCATCHNSTKQDGKLDLTGILSAEKRLKAIQRVLTDDPALSMPKGKEITDQLRGELIAELTADVK